MNFNIDTKGLNGRLVKNTVAVWLWVIGIVCTIVIIGCSCHDDILPPPPDKPKGLSVHLAADDVAVTELWLKITTNDVHGTFSLQRDSVTILTNLHAPIDTVIVDEGLLPKHTYIYKADTSAPVAITTMDTTSHNFVWQIDTLGDGNGSTLRDVYILNDTTVYAVGEIYVKDSMGNYNTDPYNFLRWDGKKWNMQSITYVPVLAVYAFSTNDIWAGTSAPYHWDGSHWKVFNVTGLFNGYISKIWGTSSSNVFMVGTNGSIMHYNGSVWRKMESGTNVDLLDVYGSPDGSVVWACGYYRSSSGTFLLRYNGTTWQTAYDGTHTEFQIHQDTISGAYTGVYTPSKKRIFIGSSAGIYSAFSSTQGEGKRLSFTPTYFPGFPNGLRGTNINDITIVGDYSFIAHYNGFTWKYYNNLSSSNIRLWSVAHSKNQIIAVGYNYDMLQEKAIIFRGSR